MNRPTVRRARTLGTTLALTAALTAAPAATAQAATKVPTAVSPVGTWSGTVDHAEGRGDVTLSFHPGGVLCLSSGGGADGGGEGRGTWRTVRGNIFNFSVTERLYDGAGTTTGYVGVQQVAKQQGSGIHSFGISRISDADRNLLKTAPAEVRVTKVSKTPTPC